MFTTNHHQQKPLIFLPHFNPFSWQRLCHLRQIVVKGESARRQQSCDYPIDDESPAMNLWIFTGGLSFAQVEFDQSLWIILLHRWWISGDENPIGLHHLYGSIKAGPMVKAEVHGGAAKRCTDVFTHPGRAPRNVCHRVHFQHQSEVQTGRPGSQLQHATLRSVARIMTSKSIRWS